MEEDDDGDDDDDECFLIFMKCILYSCHVFEKYSDIKFHENPSNGSRVVPRGLTDRQI